MSWAGPAAGPFLRPSPRQFARNAQFRACSGKPINVWMHDLIAGAVLAPAGSDHIEMFQAGIPATVASSLETEGTANRSALLFQIQRRPGAAENFASLARITFPPIL